MSEYTEVEQPFFQQLQSPGWHVIDQVTQISIDPPQSPRANFRPWLLPNVYTQAVATLNIISTGIVNGIP